MAPCGEVRCGTPRKAVEVGQARSGEARSGRVGSGVVVEFWRGTALAVVVLEWQGQIGSVSRGRAWRG